MPGKGVLHIPAPCQHRVCYSIRELEQFMTPKEMSRFLPWYNTLPGSRVWPGMYAEVRVREFLDMFRYGRPKYYA